MSQAITAPVLEELPQTAYPCSSRIGVEGSSFVQLFADTVNGTLYMEFGLVTKFVDARGLHGLVTVIDEGQRRLMAMDGMDEGVMVLGPADRTDGISWFFTEIWTESEDPLWHRLLPTPRWAWNETYGRPDAVHEILLDGSSFLFAYERTGLGEPTSLGSFYTDLEGARTAIMLDHKARDDEYPGYTGFNQDVCDQISGLHGPYSFNGR